MENLARFALWPFAAKVLAVRAFKDKCLVLYDGEFEKIQGGPKKSKDAALVARTARPSLSHYTI